MEDINTNMLSKFLRSERDKIFVACATLPSASQKCLLVSPLGKDLNTRKNRGDALYSMDFISLGGILPYNLQVVNLA